MKFFYYYLLKYRYLKLKDSISGFVNQVYEDYSFLKILIDYYEISLYLELNVDYLDMMVMFDEVWEKYEVEVYGK